ncbi:hypothetical protein Tco_0412302 [Tanacetum coccineum]
MLRVRTNGKLIYNIPYMNGSFMSDGIFLEQGEAVDQAIQTILLGLPEDIYAVVDSYCTTGMIYVSRRQNANGWKAMVRESVILDKYVRQNVGYQVVPYAVQNRCVQKVGIGWVIVVSGLANQIVMGMFDLMAAAADLDEIEEVNANCILMANLQHAIDTLEEQYTELLEPIPEPHEVPQNDSNVISEVSSVEQGGGTVEQHFETIEENMQADEIPLAKAQGIGMENEVSEEMLSVKILCPFVQNPTIVETFDLQTELERTKERLENCIIKKEKEYVVLWNNLVTSKIVKMHICKISYDKSCDNVMKEKIQTGFLQAQWGDSKGNVRRLTCVQIALDPLPQKLE